MWWAVSCLDALMQGTLGRIISLKVIMDSTNNTEGEEPQDKDAKKIPDPFAVIKRTAHAITALGLIEDGNNKLSVSPWWLSSVCLPYKDPIRNGEGPEVWERVNGNVRFTLSPYRARGKTGAEAREFPFGVWPRLILIWLAQQVTLMGDDIGNLRLPDSFDAFKRELGISSEANRGGNTKRLCIEQVKRLLGSSIVIDAVSEEQTGNGRSVEKFSVGHMPIGDISLVISKTNGEIEDIEWGAPVKLSPQFIDSVRKYKFPIYKEAVSAFSKAPFQLDIYLFLVARLYTPKHAPRMSTTRITWEQLYAQFGGHHSRVRDFRRDFIRGLESVKVIYKTARVETTTQYLILHPSKNHISEKHVEELTVEG